jgi:hypothetical protein
MNRVLAMVQVSAMVVVVCLMSSILIPEPESVASIFKRVKKTGTCEALTAAEASKGKFDNFLPTGLYVAGAECGNQSSEIWCIQCGGAPADEQGEDADDDLDGEQIKVPKNQQMRLVDCGFIETGTCKVHYGVRECEIEFAHYEDHCLDLHRFIQQYEIP